MKLIIIEGTDNVGKDTVINKLYNEFKNCKIIHCEKPPKLNSKESSIYQFNYFNKLNKYTIDNYKNYDCIIHNRSWYGEYVYGCMYRDNDQEFVKSMINKLEIELINNIDNIYYITLLSNDIKFLSNNEDGLSLSSGKESLILEETERFKEIFKHSIIVNKHIIYVNNKDKFRDKDEIFNEILTIINK